MRKLMRFSILTLLIFSATSSFAQKIQWKARPDKTFVYQLSNAQLEKFVRDGDMSDSILIGMMGDPVTSFKKTWENAPEQGHFFYGNIVQNRVQYSYQPIYPFQVFLFNEHGALTLQVVDNEGNIRSDAKVRIKGNWFLQHKKIPFNKKSKTYTTVEWSKNTARVLTVELDDFVAVFTLNKHFITPWYGTRGDYGKYTPEFYSYMITDKNKYKPGETVRFKSYILNGQRQPMKQELEIWTTNRQRQPQKIGTLSPYNPGGYAGEFVIHDSLKMSLDYNYPLRLQKKSGRIVANTYFRYEDYELYDNNLSVQLKQPVHYAPESNSIEIKTTDANGLVLQDASATITIRRNQVHKSYVDLLVMPNILLEKQISLNNDNATEFEIPATLFENTDCSYTVEVDVLTFDNQRMQRRLGAYFYNSKYEIGAKIVNDSIRFEFFEQGKSKFVAARLAYKGMSTPAFVDLPHTIPFDQNISTYTITSLNPVCTHHFDSRNVNHGIDVIGGITGDSVKLEIANPLKLNLSWVISRGDMQLQRGAGKECVFTLGKTNMDVEHYIDIFYTIADRNYTISRSFSPMKDHLLVEVNLPDRVYPGQTIDATISVKDATGRPMKDVDLTAMSVNSLLNYHIPELPYYGDMPKSRGYKAAYGINKTNHTILVPLDFDKWSKAASLYSMNYYCFSYPRNGMFRHTVETIDSITQFAPYVMRNGEAVNVYVILDNGQPTHFSWTDNLKGYSFPVSDTTKHSIMLRLHDRVLVFDSLIFEPHKKTILSVELDHLPSNVKQYDMVSNGPNNTKLYQLYPQEKDVYSKHISSLPIKNPTMYTFIKQDSNINVVFHRQLMANRNSVLAGPILPVKSSYNNGVEYRHEGGFRYEFEDNVVYKYQLQGKDIYPTNLAHKQSVDFSTLNQYYYSLMYLNHTIAKINADARRWLPNSIRVVQSGLDINLRLPVEKDSTGISNLFFINKENDAVCFTSNMRYSREYINLTEGVFDIILLYNNGKYLKYDSLKLQKDYYTELNMAIATLCQKDTLATRLLKLNPVKPHYVDPNRYDGGYPDQYPTTINVGDYVLHSSGISAVKGYVAGDDNEPLIGATVRIKGTNLATYTDINGFFEIDTEGHNVLSVSYVGYATEEVLISSNAEIRIILLSDYSMIDDIVVTGYGTRPSHLQRKAVGSKQYSRVPGPQFDEYVMNASMGDVEESRVNSKEYVLDVAFLDGESEAESPAVEFRAAEDRMYEEIMMISALRSNFSDVGFWEPRLVTDKDGKANFVATIPDNITMWNAVVYGMNNRLQTGTYKKSIKSYKPLMAELKNPQFLVEGDSSYFAGNIRNYTSDMDITGRVRFAIDADTVMNKEINFSNSYQEKMLVRAMATDSITTTYMFNRDDGYEDGERRTIGIVPQGTEIAEGLLEFLQNNKPATLKALNGETVNVKITGSQLDVYMNVSADLRAYKYACNEQLASKLMGLINYKLYQQFKEEKFKYDKDVKAIITRLTANQNSSKLWSWWGNSSSTSYWMSAHVLRALKLATDNGYAVGLNINYIAQDYIDTKPFRKASMSDIDILHALSEWGGAQNYAPALDMFEKEIRKLEIREDSMLTTNKHYVKMSYLKEKLMLWEIRQQQDINYSSDSINKYLKKDVLGAVYCDDGIKRYWYADNIQTTLIAYRIAKRDSVLSHLKEAMQMYILGTKHYGWNTYQASSALSTIMPDLLAESVSKDRTANVTLKGKDNRDLTKFPYEIILNPGEELRIEKQSGTPLILTAYSFKRVTTENIGEAFEVSTKLNTGDTLTAGHVSILTAKVVVKQRNAEHVMIEIPIPAGCSYNSKPNSHYRSYEVHREYFKEKTVIFCEKLPEGTYEFNIELLPRYTGRYILNPAKVEMMYFPTINANNDLRKIEVAEKE